MKFDILKAEQIAENKKGFDGRTVGSLIGIFGGGSMGQPGRRYGCRIGADRRQHRRGSSACATRSWTPTPPSKVAQGYKDLKMEVGATGTSVMGVSEPPKGGVGLDTMVQRLVQTLVWDIDPAVQVNLPAPWSPGTPRRARGAPHPEQTRPYAHHEHDFTPGQNTSFAANSARARWAWSMRGSIR